MKRLNIPTPKYDFTDASWIQKDLDKLLQRRKNDGDNLTLYGAYKYIRSMLAYAALGDYVILSQCVNFFQSNKLTYSEREVRRCMNYFENYDPKKIMMNRVLTARLMG